MMSGPPKGRRCAAPLFDSASRLQVGPSPSECRGVGCRGVLHAATVFPFGVWIVVGFLSGRLCGQDVGAEDRLIDGPPFDTIVLKEPAKEYHVAPLDLKPRAPLETVAAERVFEVHLLKFPDRTYRIRGEAIDRIILFEQRVLTRVEQHVADREFERAYETLRFLDRFSPKFPGLEEAHLRTLAAEARYRLERDELEHAWVAVLELTRRDPTFESAAELMAQAAQRLIQDDIAKKRERAAYSRYELFAERFAQNPDRKKIAATLRDEAEKSLREAERASAERQWRRALALARRAKRLWPESGSSRDLEAELQKTHPLIVVGVRQLTDRQSRRWGDWEASRHSSLLDGSGGKYSVRQADGQRVFLKSQQSKSQESKSTRGDGGPSEIVEQIIGDSSWQTLWRNGDLAAIDRVWPWEVADWKRRFGDRVRPYRFTTVHILVVNPRSDWLSDPLVRQAIRAGIHRQQIVDRITGDGDSDASDVGWPSALPFPKESMGVRIPVPRYRPEVMVALLRRAWTSSGREGPRPRLVLVRPGDLLSRRACDELRQQLELGGLGPQVVVQTETTAPPPGSWDLWYVPWYAMQPDQAVSQVLGMDSPLGQPPGEILLAMAAKPAETAEQTGRQRPVSWDMSRVASAISASAPMIPLWEFREYFLKQPGLTGLANRPTSLYENIGEWHYESK